MLCYDKYLGNLFSLVANTVIIGRNLVQSNRSIIVRTDTQIFNNLNIAKMSDLSSTTDVKRTCQLCGYQALQKTILKLHSQAAHEGRRFQCLECEYQATQKSNIDIHKKSIHMGQQFQCNE